MPLTDFSAHRPNKDAQHPRTLHHHRPPSTDAMTATSDLLRRPVTIIIVMMLVGGCYSAPAANIRGITPLSRCPASKGIDATSSTSSSGVSRGSNTPCRHFLSGRRGTITTPGFPSQGYPVPFICSWFINATAFEPDSFITLYLTQMYLTRGVRAVQYSALNVNESHFSTVGRKELDELHTSRARPFSVYRIKARYLEIQVNLNEPINANVRVDRRLMDVYGFNITYEIQPNGSRIRSDTCNAVNCTFNGHCYANHNYSEFQCSCLPGFSGKYCEYGPDCNPSQGINLCKNGGKCSYRTGATVVRCNCPANYNGSLCEYRRPFIPSRECLSRFRLNCSHRCVGTDGGGAVCRCPPDHALKSDALNCYPLVPVRILGQLEIDRPANLNDTQLLEGITNRLRRDLVGYTAGKITLGSLDLVAPNSNRLSFLLWNSENYNLSRGAPVASALRSRNHPNLTKTTTTTTTMRTTTSTALPISLESSKSFERIELMASNLISAMDSQWKNSYTTLVHMMNNSTWKMDNQEMVSLDLKINLTLLQVPALVIQWVRMDVKDGRVREGYPFIAACKANGSKQLRLHWFKDGFPLDPSGALLRNVSVYVHHTQDLRGFYTLNLEVKAASVSDRGEYECRASDWGQTARMSVFLDVITPPVLDLMPANPSVLPNSSVTLTCRDENHLARRTMTKYVWLKNGFPIESNCDEIIEDLTPVGSLLKIRSIQESVNFTCKGLNGSVPSQQMTRISVVKDRAACASQNWMGLTWSLTAVDSTNFQFCPTGYVGAAKRFCRSQQHHVVSREGEGSERMNNNSESLWRWDPPDFSNCAEKVVAELHRKMKLIMLGYAVGDVPSIVALFSRQIQNRLDGIQQSGKIMSDSNEWPFLPGEGNAFVQLAKALETFLFKRADALSETFWNTTAVEYFHALDLLLSITPRNFLSPDNPTPVLRLMQNYISILMEKNPTAELPTKSLFQHRITSSDRLEFKHQIMLPTILNELKGFIDIQPLAPAQFTLPLSASANNESDSSRTIETIFILNQVDDVKLISSGEYLCAMLPLEPLNHSVNWDAHSCSIERDNSTSFRCQCPQYGTTILLHALRVIEESQDSSMDLWLLVWIAGSGSHLIVMVTLVVLVTRWYRRRTLWAWFYIQLAIGLLPLSTSYIIPPEIGRGALWTILLTGLTYHYLSTVLAMAIYLKVCRKKKAKQSANLHQVFKDEEMNKNNAQRSMRYIGFSFGVSLMLTGIHSLLEEITHGAYFVSWLLEFRSVSGILFCLTYSSFILLLVAFYFKRSPAVDTQPISQQMAGRERCYLLLTLLSLPLTGAMITDRHCSRSLSERQMDGSRSSIIGIHCTVSLVHLASVFFWSTLVLSLSGDGFFCNLSYFLRRNKLPTTETITEMLDATAMMESPRDSIHLAPDADGILTSEVQTKRPVRNNSTHSSDTAAGIPEIHVHRSSISSSNRRPSRIRRATSPLLERAGLGPDVQRAFGLDDQEERHQLMMEGHREGAIVEITERQRNDSSTTLQDDQDSGFGPSGGGGSQKLSGFDRFSDAWKILRRIRWKIPVLLRSSNDGGGGGSFHSRQSTMSSATTAEFGAEQSATTITEIEVVPQSTVSVAPAVNPYPARRSRTRWTEDYGRENELPDSREENMMIEETSSMMKKPFRGRCLIRCSPERSYRWNGNYRWEQLPSSCRPASNREIIPMVSSSGRQTSCERCWHNPETPYCDLCETIAAAHQYHEENQSLHGPDSSILIRAVIEKPPTRFLENSEYLDMDPAGSLAIDQQKVKPAQVYYNLGPGTSPTRRPSRTNSIINNQLSLAPTACKKILSGRIAKKYRQSVRNVTRQLNQQHLLMSSCSKTPHRSRDQSEAQEGILCKSDAAPVLLTSDSN